MVGPSLFSQRWQQRHVGHLLQIKKSPSGRLSAADIMPRPAPMTSSARRAQDPCHHQDPGYVNFSAKFV